MVERFRIWAHDCDPEITPDERGGWVTHFDYAALESNVATLRAENNQLRRELDAIRNKTLEEAAKVVERGKGIYVNGHPDIVKSLFAAANARTRAINEAVYGKSKP